MAVALAAAFLVGVVFGRVWHNRAARREIVELRHALQYERQLSRRRQFQLNADKRDRDRRAFMERTIASRFIDVREDTLS